MAFPQMPPVNYLRQLNMFKPYVPHRLRFWSIVFIALCYQIAGGIYLASLNQMVGELSLLNEDVTMGGYCTIIGLNIIFPMLFRWKFGLYTRQLWFVSSVMIILCSIASMYISTPVLFWAICLIAGYFKMMGMFGCMSSIQVCITPTRSFGVFLPVIYVIVNGSMQLTGLIASYVTYFTNWRMMNLVAIVLMLAVETIVYFFMSHNHRSGPPIPLKGIDWIGQLLWVSVCVCGAWLFTFGEHYDWWNSIEIWRATFLFIFLLGTTIIYSYYKKNAYIDLKAFGYKSTWQLIILLLFMAVISGAMHVFMPIYLSGILHYDSLNIISLNYPELAGIIMGAIFTYFILIRWKWKVRRYFFAAFFFAIYYLVTMYFLCSTETEKYLMYLGVFSFGLAEVMVDTMATYYLSQTIPFPHFFMNITIIGFARCGLGTALGGGIAHRIFSYFSAKSFMNLSEGFVNAETVYHSIGNYDTQSLLMALRDSYGCMTLIGIIVLLFILMSNYENSIKHYVPKVFSVWKWMTKRKSEDPMLT